MFNVAITTFHKKYNSTLFPPNFTRLEQCVLKDGASILAPILGLDLGIATDVSLFNYAHIPNFHRYYFIKNWVWDSGLWWAYLEVDVLASWKSAIGANKCYLLRSATHWDGNIVDTFFPAKTNEWFDHDVVGFVGNTPWAMTYEAGFYVVGIINGDSASGGAVSYYAMSTSQFANFKGQLLGTTEWALGEIEEISEDLWKSLFNPYQYIASCMWFPIKNGFPSGQSVSTIPFGWWEVSSSATKIASLYYDIPELTVTAGGHPQASERGNFLNASPFSEYTLYAPPFGEFQLDPNIVAQGIRDENIHIAIRVDLTSGMGCLLVTTYVRQTVEDTPVYEVVPLIYNTTMVAVPITLAQVNRDNIGTVSVVTNAVSGMIGNLALGHLTGAITTATSGIVDAIQTRVPKIQMVGSSGSIAQYQGMDFRVVSRFRYVVDDCLYDKGRPCCAEYFINTCTGYVQVLDSHVVINGCSSTELEKINSLLNEGFFYE